MAGLLQELLDTYMYIKMSFVFKNTKTQPQIRIKLK